MTFDLNLTPDQASKLEPRIVGPASDLSEGNRRCTCCERELKSKVAWLELDQRTSCYHDFGGVPPERSQGFFPFGLACARKMLAEARTAAP